MADKHPENVELEIIEPARDNDSRKNVDSYVSTGPEDISKFDFSIPKREPHPYTVLNLSEIVGVYKDDPNSVTVYFNHDETTYTDNPVPKNGENAPKMSLLDIFAQWCIDRNIKIVKNDMLCVRLSAITAVALLTPARVGLNVQGHKLVENIVHKKLALAEFKKLAGFMQSCVVMNDVTELHKP